MKKLGRAFELGAENGSATKSTNLQAALSNLLDPKLFQQTDESFIFKKLYK